jgi:polyhydroxyalkanoate synthase
VQGDAKAKARIEFAVQQCIDAAAPSNYLALNPEVQRLALDSGGASIAKGLQLLWGDLRKGKLSQTDDEAFEVGRNVATSEGSVVFENELFQLIEYKPLTPKVHERPLLLVPPCINKYYILDLQPDNSLIRYAVEQGHRTFVVSWRNPDESLRPLDLGRLHRARRHEGHPRGAGDLRRRDRSTRWASASAAPSWHGAGGAGRPGRAAGRQPDPADHPARLQRHRGAGHLHRRGLRAPARMSMGNAERPGLLKGSELAHHLFSFLRPNDLVWNYVVGNYLKGEAPPAFDLLYWNGDSTNLPGRMYCWYLRHTYLENELKQPGRLTVCGEKVDLGAIRCPVFIYGSREDHIVPWPAAYASTQRAQGPGKKRFVLGRQRPHRRRDQPASKGKRSHWVGPNKLPADPRGLVLASPRKCRAAGGRLWSPGCQSQAARWCRAQGAMAAASTRSIEPAPGRYVKAKPGLKGDSP